MDDRLEVLRHSPVLDGFSDDALQVLATVTRDKLYSNAQTLQVQGETPKDLGVLFIGSGRLRCEVTDSDGKALGMGTLIAGDHLGGMRLFGDTASPLTVVAEGEVSCLLIDRAGFQTLQEQQPEVGMQLLFALARDFGRLLSESGTLFADFAQFAARKINLAERGTFGSYTDFGFDPNSQGFKTGTPRG